MKQRFSSLDVKVIAHELSTAICTLRVSNVYDLSSRIFLFKFAKPNHRQQMVVDSGFRCHLSKFARSTAAEPSQFVARLRKFLRSRRVTSIAQVGTDRIIDIQFSDGQYHLFLEFYAGGNLVLTDKELKILALLRIVPEGQGEDELRVGLQYKVESRQNYGGVPPLTKERLKKGLESALAKTAESNAAGKKQRGKAGGLLRKALVNTLPEFPPMLVDHAFRAKGFDPATPVEDVLKSDEHLDSVLDVLEEAERVIAEITAADVAKGYIIARPAKKRSQKEDNGDADHELDKENENLMYEDFHPFRPRQFEDDLELRILEFDGFNATVDEFFSSIESQKLESRLTDREENARRKLEAARTEHAKRVGGLQQVQELNVVKAQAIEGNLQRIEEATAAVNGLIAQGMDWVEIARLIEMEQARDNPVAKTIKLPLKLYENTVTLLLAEEDFDEEDYSGDETDSDVSDSDDEGAKPTKPVASQKPVDKRLAVDVDLGLSPWANARQYYDQKKFAAVKEQKTLQSSEMALKSTELKITADLKKGLKQEKQLLRPVRKQYWFEKFFYFVSSEGYLVLGGHDGLQSDILYRKYLSKGDVFVHADLPGAASMVVKNRPGMSDSPVPISTLSQAGTYCVSTSNAWDSKAIMAAWWAECGQVSKTAPTGDILEPGSFHIKGRKNFLPPAQLLLGFGVMFRVSEASMANHKKNRAQSDRAPQETKAAESAEDEEMFEKSEEEIDDESDHENKIHEDEEDKESEDEVQINEEEGSAAPNQGNEDSDEEGDKNDPATAETYDNPLQSSTGAKSIQTGMKDLSIDPEASADVGEDSEDEHEAEEATHADSSKNATSTNTPSEPATRDGTVTPSTQKAKAPSQVRGKRGKRSKIKSKYAEQDDDDRALAMKLLGSGAAQQKAQAEAATKAQKEAESLAQKERRREQHLRSQQAGKEAEEGRKANLDTQNAGMEAEEVAELEAVENLVGTVMPGDEIVDCLAVCGPWDSMGSKLLWRVKMQPGAQKKGKAVKEILSVWGKLIADREKRKPPPEGSPGHEEERLMRKQAEFVKGLRDVEVIGVVPVGKVRVMGGQGEKGKGGAAKNGGAKGKGARGGKGSKKK